MTRIGKDSEYIVLYEVNFSYTVKSAQVEILQRPQVSALDKTEAIANEPR